MKTIYLAGPDVFFPGAAAHFDALEARCAALGPARLAWDQAHGFMIEELGQAMNLMLARSTALFETFDAALGWLRQRLDATPDSGGDCQS